MEEKCSRLAAEQAIGQAALETLKLHAVPTWTAGALPDLHSKVSLANLPDAMKEEMMQSMDSLSVSGQGAVQLSLKPQSLHNLPPFLTSRDWEVLEKGTSVDGLKTICGRLQSLGVRSMKEDIKKSAIAVQLHVLVNVQHQALPGAWPIYFMVQDLVATFWCIADNDLPRLKAYPVSPAHLTAAFKARAYGRPALGAGRRPRAAAAATSRRGARGTEPS